MKKVVSWLLGVALLLAMAFVTPSEVKAAYSIENAPFLSTVRESTLSHVTLGWTPREGAVGYQVYMKRNVGTNAKFRKVATVKGLTYVTESLDSGNYSFKVRAYAKKNGKTVYSPFSSVKTIDTSLVSYGEFGLGYLQDEKELSELVTMVGGMTKKSSKYYPDFFAKGNDVSIGLNRKIGYPKPYLKIKVTGNKGFYFGGICCGQDRTTALAVSGDEFSSYNGGKTFVIGTGSGVYAGFKLVPTYDKNDIITELVFTVRASG